MLKAIKIRIYPNKEQTQFINKQLGSCRFVYNECLAYKTNTYKEEKVGTIKLEHMVGAKYSLTLNDNLDLPSFFLFSLGAIILRDNLLL